MLPALVYIYDGQFVIKMVTVMQLIIVRNKDSLYIRQAVDQFHAFF